MRHRGIRGSHDWTSGALTKQEFWFCQLFVANWPIACTTWEPDIKYWFWVYLRTLTARRSSVVTVRPAPHPHCSKSRLSSWDEVKMRCRFTTLVLIKKKADNFYFLFFALDMQSSTSPWVAFILCPATTKKKSSYVSWWWLRSVFSPARSYHVQRWATDRRRCDYLYVNGITWMSLTVIHGLSHFSLSF